VVNGRAELRGLEPGSWRMVVELAGSDLATEGVLLEPGKTTVLTVALPRSPAG
jgi:hypothetical protein